MKGKQAQLLILRTPDHLILSGNDPALTMATIRPVCASVSSKPSRGTFCCTHRPCRGGATSGLNPQNRWPFILTSNRYKKTHHTPIFEFFHFYMLPKVAKYAAGPLDLSLARPSQGLALLVYHERKPRTQAGHIYGLMATPNKKAPCARIMR